MGVSGEALQLYTIYTFFSISHVRTLIWYCKSRENLYQVLQVMHARWISMCNKIEVSIILIIVPSYAG